MRSQKALRQAVLLALVMGSCGAALAQTAAEADTAGTDVAQAKAQPADARQAEAMKAPARPFIERSLVIAREQVGKFKLYRMNDFPGSPGAGIAVRYQHEDFPSVRIDLYVYPAGRFVRDKVLARGMDEVRTTLEHAASEGKYSDLAIGDQTEFDLRLVEEDGSMPSAEGANPPASDQGDASDPDRAIADAYAANDYRRGLRLGARLTIQDEPQNSLAFLFYRGLYLVKGRISASPTLLPGEAFDRFANHAMASLVPEISTRSTGGCSQGEIVLVDDDFKSKAVLAGRLAAASEISQQEACAATLDEAVPAVHRAMPLVYAPDMWN